MGYPAHGIRARALGSPVVDWRWYTLVGIDGLEWRIYGYAKDYGWRGATVIGGLMVDYLRGFYQEVGSGADEGKASSTNETQ